MKGALLGGAAGAAAVGLFVSGMVVAGPLNPPAGAPAPTYRTLSEVEPRIPVQSLPGDSTKLHIISAPGSYYLTGDLHVPDLMSGVDVNAANVTLDLNGFSIIGTPNSETGVVAPGRSGITVRNGTIQGMGWYGVFVGSGARIEDVTVTDVVLEGIQCESESIVSRCIVMNGGRSIGSGIESGDRCTIIDCTSSGNSDAGIVAGSGSTIQGCTASSNAAGIVVSGTHGNVLGCTASENRLEGIVCVGPAVVRDCTARSNEFWGIHVQQGSVVAGCNAAGNGAIGNSGGIRAGASSVVTASTAAGNTGVGFRLDDRSRLVDAMANNNTSHGVQGGDGLVLTGCGAENNAGDGFNVHFGGTVRECTARGNTGDGIETSSGGHIVACTLDGNGAGAGQAAGLTVTGNACRVEGNHFVGNDWGINFTSTLNTAFRNSFKFNSVNIQGTAGNDVAPTGNAATATSAWANLQL